MNRRAWGAICVLLGAAAASVYLFGLRRESSPAPIPATPPPPSRHSVAPDGSGSAPAAARADQLALEIERALVAVDAQQRETAFVHLLPELLRVDPARAVRMVARQEPGEARDALRNEVTRQWIMQDRDATVAWLHSLQDEEERRDSATQAVRTLAARSPADAIAVADQFGVGRDDGSLEHLVQIWATADPDAAARWIESQPPDDPRTRQLKARIDEVRQEQRSPP